MSRFSPTFFGLIDGSLEPSQMTVARRIGFQHARLRVEVCPSNQHLFS